jgi:REP element-mobilizing transposase RayT
MSIKRLHKSTCPLYFFTFTCFDWLHHFEIVKGYDLVYRWFDLLKETGCFSAAWVIMPNHLHGILHFSRDGLNLNKIIANGKRFMAYEMIRRLEQSGQGEILNTLASAVSMRERKKGQLHKVFRDSFDAKCIYSKWFLDQKLDYIHLNPVRGKWKLVEDYTDYEHSSASFYVLGQIKAYEPFDLRLL